jgi:hypothetical protein
MMSQKFFATAAMGLALLSGAAAAQAAAPARVRGTVVSLTATNIDVTTRAGADAQFAVTPNTHFLSETTGALTDIKAGSYIGSAAVPAAGGKLRALEVTVFPPEMAGVGEGHYAWDLGKSSSMTNGTVGSLVVSDGNTMTVKYDGGEKQIMVPADVPIVMLAPGSANDVKAGVKVIVAPVKGDPKTANAVLYGLNGITPPQ